MCSDHDSLELARARIAGETARHYGTMRFAMFTVFSAVLGALLAFAFSQGGSLFLAHAPYRVGLGVVGLVLSVLFLLAEYRISTLVTFYQEEAFTAGALAPSPELEPTRPNVDDGWLKDEELLGTAELAMQLEAIDAVEHATAGGEASVAGGGGGKKGKKKKQKITLMSTGGRRGN